MCLFVFYAGFSAILRPLCGYVRKSVACLIKRFKAAHLIASRSDVTPQITFSSPNTSNAKSPINFAPY